MANPPLVGAAGDLADVRPASAAMAPKRGYTHRLSTPGASPPPPLDAVFEILSWLPASSLHRFQCVCRSWRALVSDPAFVAAHRSRAEPLLVAATDFLGDCGRPTTSVKIMDAHGYVVRLVQLYGLWKVRASVDSIILLTSRHHDDSPAVRVVDLATGETIASCLRPTEIANRVTTWFGFGRAARSGDGKLIRIRSRSLSLSHHRLTCEVLVIRDGSAGWRQTRSPPSKVCDYSFRYCSDGAPVNGRLHFLSSTWQDGIACFDLESEEWTAAIRRPREGARWRKEDIRLAELNGAVCITHVNRHTVDLWLLLADTNKDVWVKAYTIPVGYHPRDLVPLRVMRSGGKLLLYRRRYYGSPAILQEYDPHSGKCSNVEKGANDITAGTIGLCSSHLDHRLCS